MVKKGGTKRKIAIEMIQKSDYLRVTCTKRREGLFSKASQLCLLSDAQIAILATPPSSESNVSFYSFGHSSVDAVVSSFLSGQRPRPVPVQEDTKETREDVGICLSRKNLGLGFWWNNESLNKSENPQEISDAIDSMWTLLSNLKELSAEEALVNDHKDLKKNEKSDVVLQHGTQDQTLNLKSNTSAICCVPDELSANSNEIVGISPNSLIMLENKKSQIEESLAVVKIEKIRMVKKGGTKRKIAIEMIQKRDSLRVTCTKRREGLFSKASQLCLLSGAQIAILATPPSSESNVSFYSFGHSSVDAVVSSFLSGQRPVPVPEDTKEMREDVGICLTRKNLGLGFWWNNERLARSENPQELSDAIDSMWTLLSSLKELRAEEAFVNDHEDLKKNEKNDVVLQRRTQDQTLNLQSTSAICCIPDDLPQSVNEITQEPDQTLDIQSSSSAIFCVPDESPATYNEITEEQDQILSICESFCVTDNNNTNNALPEANLDYDQDMDIDQLIDFDTPFESSLDDWFSENTHQETTSASLLTNSEAVVDDHVSVDPNLFSDFEGLEDSDLVFQRCLDGDDRRFSDFFHDFANTIAAL
ncbi:Transcription factor MADS-box [Arabidopsis suecica]|uniref:Transcription factor MADS-box n=1 Tax=Arabidopsis suecica TaxID=45249 RepID=A0A8T1XSL5_ARASU|nr:Transcription factor MADS-box [Arabidopsis suecica]